LSIITSPSTVIVGLYQDRRIFKRSVFLGEEIAEAAVDNNRAVDIDRPADSLNLSVVAAHPVLHNLRRNSNHVGVSEPGVGFDGL